MAADDEVPQTRHVRIGYAVTGSGALDVDRIGTVEELPRAEARRLVSGGRAQYVEAPQPQPDVAAAQEPGMPLGPGPQRPTVERWGASSARPAARPRRKTDHNGGEAAATTQEG